MDISKNHVSYSESQKKLTVTTFYDESTFLDICLKKNSISRKTVNSKTTKSASEFL